MRRNTPPLLQKMFEREVGELQIRYNAIYEPKSGCRVAYDFPSEAAAINAALRMNEIADWFGVVKARSEGLNPNCQDELKRIVEDFGGKLSTGNNRSGLAESACSRAVAAVERS